MHACTPVQLYTILYVNAPHQLRVEIEDSSWPEQKNLEERKEEASGFSLANLSLSLSLSAERAARVSLHTSDMRQERA